MNRYVEVFFEDHWYVWKKCEKKKEAENRLIFLTEFGYKGKIHPNENNLA